MQPTFSGKLFYYFRSLPSIHGIWRSAYQHRMKYHEDCTEKIFDFCSNVLKIDNPKAVINIDRSHRIGEYKHDAIRPIVAKFKDSDSKYKIKTSLKSVNLKDTDFNVSEQYPQEVKERRKTLIPIMLQARREGKKAVLVRDKLYINHVQYTPANGSPPNSTA